jgi:predicted nucleotidyltransferase
MMKIDSKILNFILEKILSVYNPRRVYLYGSQAWGDPTNTSDIDLFVILDSSDLDMDERIRIGARALSGSGLDVDLMVMTEKELNERKDHPSTLVHKVITKGIKLYEAA